MIDSGALKKLGGIAGVGIALAGCHMSGERVADENTKGTDLATGREVPKVGSPAAVAEVRKSDDAMLDRLIADGDAAYHLYTAVESQYLPADLQQISKPGSCKVSVPKSLDFSRPEGRELASVEVPLASVESLIRSESQRLGKELRRAALGLSLAYERLDGDQRIKARLALGGWSAAGEQTTGYPLTELRKVENRELVDRMVDSGRAKRPSAKP